MTYIASIEHLLIYFKDTFYEKLDVAANSVKKLIL